MKHERKGGAFVPENYPALQEFLPGYLHEDFAGDVRRGWRRQWELS